MRAIVHLMPSSLRREFIFLEENKVSAIKGQFDAKVFEKGPEINILGIKCAPAPSSVAAEMFDLTNNPVRQEERERVYGTGRSVSVGDIVEVAPERGGNSFWLCMSFGWKEI